MRTLAGVSGLMLLLGAGVYATGCGNGFTASTSDAGGDALSNDAPSDGPSADGPSDAGGPFCSALQPPPFFCDDFDDPTESQTLGLFGFSANTSGGSTQVDEDYVSAPHGLSTIAGPPADNSGSENGGVAKVLSINAVRSIEVWFSVKVVSGCPRFDATNGPQLVPMTLLFAGSAYAVGFTVNTAVDGVAIAEVRYTDAGGLVMTHPVTIAVRRDNWDDVRVKIDAKTSTAETIIDGMSAGTSTLAYLPTTLTAPTLIMGAEMSNAKKVTSGSCHVHLDNIAVYEQAQ
jgi:hypothetical protein